MISWRIHIQGWMNVRESYSPALEQGTLFLRRSMQFSISFPLFSSLGLNPPCRRRTWRDPFSELSGGGLPPSLPGSSSSSVWLKLIEPRNSKPPRFLKPKAHLPIPQIEWRPNYSRHPGSSPLSRHKTAWMPHHTFHSGATERASFHIWGFH